MFTRSFSLIAVFLVLFASIPRVWCADIIAHRGGARAAPENTLAAIERAWAVGADLVEIDIHMTIDGHIVVIHDEDTERVAGVKKIIKDSTLAELRTLDVGSWKGQQFAGEKIPLLSEVLATVPEDRRIVIEIKSSAEIIEPLEKIIAQSGLDDRQIVVVAFDFETVKRYKRRNPAHEVCWLRKIKKILGIIPSPMTAGRLIDKVKGAGLDGVDLKALSTVNASFIRKVRSAGLRLYVYTVNDPGKARSLFRWGVDGITTDRPRLMLDIRSRIE